MRALPAPRDPPGEFVGAVHVVVDGERSRPAVALVHGIPGSARDFRYLGPALADAGLCAVRIDMPGFGKTPIDAFPSTKAENRAAFVRQVMRALGFATFAVAGHSFGGGAALLCAAAFPDDVRALACINSIGPRRHRGGASPTVAVRALAGAMDLPVVGDALHRTFARVYETRGLKSDIGLSRETVQHHARVIAGQHYEDLRRACALVACPALVVSSSDDPLVEPASSFALARAFTAAPLVSHLHTRSGGHFLQKREAPAIAAWLAARVA